MAGLVVAYGKTDRAEVEAMFKMIRHRGTYAAGICENKRVIMAQNYLKADGATTKAGVEIPVASSRHANLRICYDGQVGNWDELARTHNIPDGPFREERLILHLYEQQGSEMFQYLNDAIFAFVISEGDKLLAARDLLGIKTLFYGWKNKTLYLASELKGIVKVTDDVYEFPPGHYMDRNGQLTQFAELPKAPPKVLDASLDEMMENIRAIIRRSLHNRVSFNEPTGSLLSGGVDSSVISYLASEAYKEKFGNGARLKTFALGLGEGSDIYNARVMASHVDSDHHEVIVDLKQVLAVLPEVIYYLESFDAPLVRSAASNFLISRHAKELGVQVLLCGEGGDEVFCGYLYLKDFPPEEMFFRQMECIRFLHNNTSLRLDRMNQCNSIRVVAPLISRELLDYSLAIPSGYKQKQEVDQKVEKWIFRKAFEGLLPETIVWRLKQEFSQGSGSAALLPGSFEDVISDAELSEAQAEYPMVRSKEEFYYFRIFTEHFGSHRAVETVGQWVCL